jgi:hypothetical protein
MEYWTDTAEMTVTGQTTKPPRDGMGVGGAGFAAEWEDRPVIQWVGRRVDIKGKGKQKA